MEKSSDEEECVKERKMTQQGKTEKQKQNIFYWINFRESYFIFATFQSWHMCVGDCLPETWNRFISFVSQGLSKLFSLSLFLCFWFWWNGRMRTPHIDIQSVGAKSWARQAKVWIFHILSSWMCRMVCRWAWVGIEYEMRKSANVVNMLNNLEAKQLETLEISIDTFHCFPNGTG